jgi:hypothetical protein
MSYTQKRIETRSNAEALVRYLDQHQPATLASVMSADVMSLNDATNALQYGIRHRMIERVELPGGHSGDLARYRPTGRSQAKEKKESGMRPFDALLVAWGIATVPPELPGKLSVRVIAFG